MDNSENVKNGKHCSKCCNSDTETYLEIYKLQMNTITETSNRRINVSRYYILALSVLVLALSVVVRGGSTLVEIFKIGDFNLNSRHVGLSVIITGVLGSLLTLSWIMNMVGYLRSNSNRYETIKKLERFLPYQFTKSMWKRMPGGNYKKYLNFASHELYTPSVFCLGFVLLTVFGVCLSFSLDIEYMYIFFVVSVVTASILFLRFHLEGR